MSTDWYLVCKTCKEYTHCTRNNHFNSEDLVENFLAEHRMMYLDCDKHELVLVSEHEDEYLTRLYEVQIVWNDQREIMEKRFTRWGLGSWHDTHDEADAAYEASYGD